MGIVNKSYCLLELAHCKILLSPPSRSGGFGQGKAVLVFINLSYQTSNYLSLVLYLTTSAFCILQDQFKPSGRTRASLMYSDVPSLTVSFLFNELNLNFRVFVLPYLHTSVLIP